MYGYWKCAVIVLAGLTVSLSAIYGESHAQTSSPSASLPCPGGKQVAFAGAEGFGRCAQGGRGGRVIEVTNLNDSGPGSLRQCAEVETGPRTCVFRVSGHIEVVKFGAGGGYGPSIDVVHPYLTIAGQTAPGDGVSVKGLIWVRADHVIIQHLRSRPGWKTPNNWNFGIGGSDVILDHVSATWSTDEGIWVGGRKNITIQWSLVAEGIQDGSISTERRQSKGINLGGPVENVTVHHNYMAMNMVRNPIIGVTATGSTQQVYDIVNNVVYYWNSGGAADQWAGKGPSHANWVGNMYVQHQHDTPWTGYPPLRAMADQVYASRSGAYLKGNISAERPADSLPERKFMWSDNGAFPDAPARYAAPVLSSETDAFTAYREVLQKVGATLPVRDSVDTRITGLVQSATVQPGLITKGTAGSIIGHETHVGGYPLYRTVAPPIDTDHDGMPDSWELARGLNPNDPSDRNADANGDGFTNLDDYLQSPVASDSTDTQPPLPPPTLNISSVF